MMDRQPDGVQLPVNADPPDPMIGRILGGQYRILSLIASGGMGRVYKGEQLSPRRMVAIKVLTPSTLTGIHDPSFRERFEREADLLARLKHPNTVTVYMSGQTEDGVYYIVMEYVEGVTLSRRLRGEHRLPPLQALGIARQICRSLREAHRESIVHRDLKPSNILLVYQGEGEEELVKVLDFGVAKIMTEESDEEAQLTRFGMFVGTPEYAAPEAAYGKAELQSDIYSVGVLLYRMLSGKVPFRGATETASLLMVVNDPVPPFDPALGLTSRVEALVMKCLEKDRANRFQTMDELIRAIDACRAELGAEPSSTAVPSMTAPTPPPVQLPSAVSSSPSFQVVSGTTIAPASVVGEIRDEPQGTGAPVASSRRWGAGIAAALGVLALGGALWWLAGSSPSPGGHDPASHAASAGGTVGAGEVKGSGAAPFNAVTSPGSASAYSSTGTGGPAPAPVVPGDAAAGTGGPALAPIAPAVGSAGSVQAGGTAEAPASDDGPAEKAGEGARGERGEEAAAPLHRSRAGSHGVSSPGPGSSPHEADATVPTSSLPTAASSSPASPGKSRPPVAGSSSPASPDQPPPGQPSPGQAGSAPPSAEPVPAGYKASPY